MSSIDYNAAMLRLFFREKKFSKDEIKRRLECNPFDGDFLEWEKNNIYNNRTFAVTIKKYGLLKSNTKVREVVVHENENVIKSLFNDNQYCIVNPNKPLHADFSSGRLIIIKGIYDEEEIFLKKLMLFQIPFIVGTTSSLPSFESDRNFFLDLAKKYDLYKIEDQTSRNKTIILNSNY